MPTTVASSSGSNNSGETTARSKAHGKRRANEDDEIADAMATDGETSLPETPSKRKRRK